jgi:fatty-acyl-CoA synthase
MWETLLTADSGTLRCWDGTAFQSASWAQVSRDALNMTAAMRRAGVAPGRGVASILTNSPLSVRGILGIWLAGGTLASLPIPARGMDSDEYGEQLATLVGHLGAETLFLDAQLAALLPERVRDAVAVHTWESTVDQGRVEPAPPGADEIAFVQYSSGSTSVPKGCMLTPRAIEAQLRIIIEVLEALPGECNVSWLPLSHDMGLFGNLLAPWLAGVDLVLSSPERFMLAPRTWFEDIADAGASFTTGNNLALRLATRWQSRALSRRLVLRAVILGGERIEWDTLTGALAAFGPSGLRDSALMPAYGLAEATLMVTRTPLTEAPRRLALDPLALAEGAVVPVGENREDSTSIVSAGPPAGTTRLLGLEESRTMQIQLRSPSLATGYLNDPLRTHSCFQDETFVTGDIGFVRDGWLYPVGRLDDLISIGGRKVYAGEIEAAINRIAAVRTGCSTIVEDRASGRQRLLLLVEARDGEHDFSRVAGEAAEAAMSKAGVTLDECLFLEKGALPKTPSGKIQRHRCSHLAGDGRGELRARVALTGALQ